MDFINQIVCGDNMKVMPSLPADSFDTIITDPPYGLGFMGKEWDTFKPDVVAEEKKRDTLSHRRRKSRNKPHSDQPSAAQAAARYDFSRNYEFQQWFTGWGIEALRVLKPGGTLLIFGGTRTYHRLACAIEDAGFILKDCIMWLYGSGFPKATDISKQLDKGHNGKVIGQKTHARKGIAAAEQRTAVGGGAFGEERVEEIRELVSPEAKLWDGWKSHGLKPAYEPILVAMKPNDGTYANNALVHGVSGLNIEGGRIGLEGIEVHTTEAKSGLGDNVYGNYENKPKDLTDLPRYNKQGRFPANIILDEVAAAMLDEQSGISKSTGGRIGNKDGAYTGIGEVGFTTKHSKGDPGFGDNGGASRFFYCAKASKRERNAGCAGMGKSSATKKGAGKRLTVGGSKDKALPRQNHHPTVKPLALMEYLCRLTMTPTGGIVLDPFAGSGTTCIACVNEGRDFVGIEKEPEYVEIARRRIEWAKKQKVEQMGLFAEQGRGRATVRSGESF